MNLMEYLQIETIEITNEKVCLNMPINDFHHQPFGLVHGGINGVLIETACSLGANQYFDNNESFAVGVDLQVHHLKAVQSGNLTAVAQPNHIGKTIQVWECNIYNELQELTSVGRCTLTNKYKKV